MAGISIVTGPLRLSKANKAILGSRPELESFTLYSLISTAFSAILIGIADD